jgi:hypothetical protein
MPLFCAALALWLSMTAAKGLASRTRLVGATPDDHWPPLNHIGAGEDRVAPRI